MAKQFEDFKGQLESFIKAVNDFSGSSEPLRNAKAKTLELLNPLSSLIGPEGLNIGLGALGQAKAINATILSLLELKIDNKEIADFVNFVVDYLNNAEKFNIPPFGKVMGYDVDQIVGGKISKLKKGLKIKLEAWEQAEEMRGNEDKLRKEVDRVESKLSAHTGLLENIEKEFHDDTKKPNIKVLYKEITLAETFFEQSVENLSNYENLLNRQLPNDQQKIIDLKAAREKLVKHDLSSYDEKLAQELGLSEEQKWIWREAIAPKDVFVEFFTNAASKVSEYVPQVVKDTTAAATGWLGGMWNWMTGNTSTEMTPQAVESPKEETIVDEFKEKLLKDVDQRIASMEQAKSEKESKVEKLQELQTQLSSHAKSAEELKSDIEQQKDKSQILLKLKKFIQKTKEVGKKLMTAIRESRNQHVVDLADLSLDQAQQKAEEATRSANLDNLPDFSQQLNQQNTSQQKLN